MPLSRTTPNLRVPAVADEQPYLLRSSRAVPAQSRQFPSLPRDIAVIGNHLPRQCGIATFTTDLCDALEAEFASARILAVPVTDAEFSYEYPARVQLELAARDVP